MKSIYGRIAVLCVNFFLAAAKPSSRGGLSKKDLTQEHLALNICYFCEANCQSWLSQNGYAAPMDYFNQLTANTEKILQNLVSDFTLTTGAVWTPNSAVDYGQACATKGGADALTQVNTCFWDAQAVYKTYAVPSGCHMAFGMLSPGDRVFKSHSAIVAIANMFQICGDLSHGMLKLQGSPEKEAKLAAHEIGHLMGIYHDGALEPAYFSYEEYLLKEYPAEWAALTEQCTIKNTQGAWHEMDPVPTGADGEWSECSKAYFNMFLKLADDPKMGAYYFYRKCAGQTTKRALVTAATDEYVTKQMEKFLADRGVTASMEGADLTTKADDSDEAHAYTERECL